MKKLCTAANLPEAHLLRHLLEQEGIPARVLNENAIGGAGELPISDVYPQLWVANEADFARARELVEKFERMPPVSQTIRCTACTEENPATFQTCWNCGATLP